ncbi:hypothetical protein D3C84_774250 [compost metagenome]
MAVAIENAEIVVGDIAFTDLVTGVNVHGQFRVLFVEAQQAREQPVLGHGMGTDDADIAAAMAGFQAQHVGQQALQHRFDNRVEAFSGRGQGDAAGPAFEQHGAEVLFQQLDLFAHRALRQVQLAGSTGETAGAHHCFKSDQGVQRGQVAAETTHAGNPF